MRSHSYIRLHLKILAEPLIDLSSMFDAARLVFSSAGAGVEIISTERLCLPRMLDVPISRCEMGETTSAQRRLFSYRSPAGDKDLVAYFVRSTIPPTSGCAAHPAGSPGVLITRAAGIWTLAHEIGHVLGLRHVSEDGRLMAGGGTSSGDGRTLHLSPLESIIIHGSPFIFHSNDLEGD